MKSKETHPGEVLGVSQKDRPLLGDAVAVVEVHQLVQRGERLVPHVVLTTSILQYLEMLNMIPITAKQVNKEMQTIIKLNIYEDMCFLAVAYLN